VLAKDRTLQLAFFPELILLEKNKNLFKQKIFIEKKFIKNKKYLLKTYLNLF
jgi:hypothetical protein